MATSWAPAWDQQGASPRVVAAEVSVSLLDPWFTQTAVPTARTPMTTWLFAQTGYTPPTPPGTGAPPPTTGQLWPR